MIGNSIRTAPMPHPLVEAFGRPTWREWRRRAEAAELAAAPVDLPSGQGQSVVLVPGFGGTEESLSTLVRWLRRSDYEVAFAPVERNVQQSAWAVDRIEEALASCTGPSILIGHSRGGQQCRVAAARRPDDVARLITLGAPVRAHVPKHFVLRATVESLRLAGRLGVLGPIDFGAEDAYESRLAAPFGTAVRWISIWSRSDGLVAWQSCLDEAALSIEVSCTHRGLVESISAFRAIAAALQSGVGKNEYLDPAPGLIGDE